MAMPEMESDPISPSPRHVLMHLPCGMPITLEDTEEVQVRAHAWGGKFGSTSALLHTSDFFPTDYAVCLCVFRGKKFCFAVTMKLTQYYETYTSLTWPLITGARPFLPSFCGILTIPFED